MIKDIYGMRNAVIHSPQMREAVMPMEESLCSIEISRSANQFVARVQTELGGLREYRSRTFEEILEQLVIDLQEEFESG